MKKSMIEIYALAVCFVCIASGGIVLGVGVYDVIQVAAPEMTLSEANTPATRATTTS